MTLKQTMVIKKMKRKNLLQTLLDQSTRKLKKRLLVLSLNKQQLTLHGIKILRQLKRKLLTKPIKLKLR